MGEGRVRLVGFHPRGFHHRGIDLMGIDPMGIDHRNACEIKAPWDPCP